MIENIWHDISYKISFLNQLSDEFEIVEIDF